MKRRLFLLLLLVAAALPAVACSIFTATSGDQVLVGANEGGDDPFGKIWTMPRREGRFGAIYFGLSFLDKQAGMNEHGLFFDYAALDPVIEDFNPYGTYIYIEEIMETCRTVEEALAFLEEHGYAINTAQMLLADASGNSAIVTPTKIIRREGSYQIATNFNVCSPEKKSGCQRFQRIETGLSAASEISVGLFKNLLHSVHVEGANTTLYSKVFDLKSKTIHLYNFHDFSQNVVINLDEVLEEGFQMHEVYDLFDHHSHAEEMFRRKHVEVVSNQIYRSIVGSEENLIAGIEKIRQTTDLSDEAFSQCLTKALIGAIIVKRLALDNYSIIHYFMPFPHAFYEHHWRVEPGDLEHCKAVLTYMEQQGLEVSYLPGGIAPEPGWIPEVKAVVALAEGDEKLARVLYEKAVSGAESDWNLMRRQGVLDVLKGQ